MQMTQACVYIVECYGFYKIGKTVNLKNRIREMQTGNPIELQVAHVIYSDRHSDVEQALHAVFADQNVHGEWFKLSDKQIDSIKSMSVHEILRRHIESLKVHWNRDPAEKVALRPDVPVPPDGTMMIVPMTILDEIRQASKPPRILFASLARLMSLAWQSFYQTTPVLHEEKLIPFLRLSRRQYFTQKADMEQRGWITSHRPSPGYIQFQFPHAIDINEVDDEYKPSQDVR
jgi:Meiotically Up-regulated Gene 113 (MUG113) protein